MHYTGRECDVSPYDTNYSPAKNIPIVSAATAWQSQNTGQVYILILNEALWMPNLPHSLIDPNQLRHFGTTVQDNPVHMSPLHLRTEDARFSMELNMLGTIIYTETRTPTEVELNSCPHIIMSLLHEWHPNKVLFTKYTRTLENGMSEISMKLVFRVYNGVKQNF